MYIPTQPVPSITTASKGFRTILYWSKILAPMCPIKAQTWNVEKVSGSAFLRMDHAHPARPVIEFEPTLTKGT